MSTEQIDPFDVSLQPPLTRLTYGSEGDLLALGESTPFRVPFQPPEKPFIRNPNLVLGGVGFRQIPSYDLPGLHPSASQHLVTERFTNFNPRVSFSPILPLKPSKRCDSLCIPRISPLPISPLFLP